MAQSLLCGIFVGGPSRRMGGRPKGLLPAPDTERRDVPLVQRLSELAARHQLPLFLIGEKAEYAGLGLPTLADRPAGLGPLGGLSALLAAVEERGAAGAIALSCDLPYLDDALFARLLHDEGATYDAMVPRRSPSDPWEPLCARYALSARPAIAEAIVRDERSLQRLLSRLRVFPIWLGPQEEQQVRDWDRPDDLPPTLRARLMEPGER